MTFFCVGRGFIPSLDVWRHPSNREATCEAKCGRLVRARLTSAACYKEIKSSWANSHFALILSDCQHATQTSIERSQEGGQQGQGPTYRGQEEKEEEEGELQHLHLQSAEAGAPRHRYLQQGHEHHELFRQRHLRAHRRRGISSCSLQPQVHHHQPRDPDRCPSSPSRRVGQARRQRGHQGRDQVHQLQVNLQFICKLYYISALFRAHTFLRKSELFSITHLPPHCFCC